MESSKTYPVKVITIGFVVLLMFSLLGFYVRLCCRRVHVQMLPLSAKTTCISPSGLLPPEYEKDPNLKDNSFTSAAIRKSLLLSFGLMDFFDVKPTYRHSPYLYYVNPSFNSVEFSYFDKKTGLIVISYPCEENLPGKTKSIKIIRLYIGPEGISEKPDKSIGKFIDPVPAEGDILPNSQTFVYDRKLRRFFKVDLVKKTTTKSSQLKKHGRYNPVQIHYIRKNNHLIRLNWVSPKKIITVKNPYENNKLEQKTKSIIKKYPTYSSGQYLLVLDKSGRIDLLDKTTLRFAGTAGFLPTPKALFASEKTVGPQDLSAYEVLPLTLINDNKYRGVFVASLARETNALALAAFDPNGQLVNKKIEHTFFHSYNRYGPPQNTPLPKAFFFKSPWAPFTTTIKYLTENFHPLILSITSYITANSIEAANGHKALFLMPNSFVAMFARNTAIIGLTKLLCLLAILTPSIVIGLLFSWSVRKDISVVGLSKRAKLWWTIGTILFGLTAYVTYRITRPKITLVTCENCGRLRRPDMDLCHHCKSTWHISELKPPMWRVVVD